MRKLALQPDELRLDAYLDGLLHDWTQTLTALGFFLIPAFFLLDVFTTPVALLPRVAGYCVAGTGFALTQLFVLRRTRPTRLSFLHGYAFTLMVGGLIARMTVDLGGFDSSYYAGLILVVVAVNVLLPWSAIHSAMNSALVVAMYVAGDVAFGGQFRVASAINNLYFLVASVIIAVTVSFVRHRLLVREFRLRAELLQALGKLDRSRNELKEARDALWGEMEVAKRIQTALLPGNRRLGPYAVAAHMRPADEVGGDYYELFQSRAGEHWVAIGDVSGHGVESGLVMMMTQVSILTHVNDVAGRKPSEVFRVVNGVLRENLARLGTHRYMTLNLIRLHLDRLTVAGKHQDILVYRRHTGCVEVVANEGSWLGILEDTAGLMGDLDIPLEEGDTVRLFTDGATEATDGTGQMFGQERLTCAFAQAAVLPLAEGLEALRAEVARFQPRPQDDVTLMLLRREPAPA